MWPWFSRFFLPFGDPFKLSDEDAFVTHLLFGTISGWGGFQNAACCIPGGEEFTALSVCHFEPPKNEHVFVDINIDSVSKQPSLLMKVIESSTLRRFFCAIMSVSPRENESWLRARISGTPIGDSFQVGDVKFGQFPLEYYEGLCESNEIVLDCNKLPIVQSEILCSDAGKIVSVSDKFFCSGNYFVFVADFTFIAIMDGSELVWLNGTPSEIEGTVSIDLPDDEMQNEFNINYRPDNVMLPSESYLVHLPCSLWGYDIYCNMHAPLPISDVPNEVAFPGLFDGKRTLEILCCLVTTCYNDITDLILLSCGIQVSYGCSLILNQNFASLPPLGSQGAVARLYGGLVPFREDRLRVFSNAFGVVICPGTSLCSYGQDGTMVPYYNHEVCSENMECEEWNSFSRRAKMKYGDDSLAIQEEEVDHQLLDDLDHRLQRQFDVSDDENDLDDNLFERYANHRFEELESVDDMPELVEEDNDRGDYQSDDDQEDNVHLVENEEILVLEQEEDQEQPDF